MQTRAVQDAIDSGELRQLDKLLRSLCPAAMWDWPTYFTYADAVKEKPTRIRMVAALAHRLLRDDHWAWRMPQMLEAIELHSLWQFRPAGNSRDHPDCAALSCRTERFDSEFWQNNHPANCARVYCRCSIRSYRFDEDINSSSNS